ncbi:hypothetical protein BYT27DRAFT_7188495 [Phlegmacium glaucopus]|nr:hypothetical protein BYT27DRAFT_7188495 [Phlegmacium glaucopus]
MVRLYASLLALILLTGSALAFSDKYQRRSELDRNLYRRDFVNAQEIPFTREDHEDIYGREDVKDIEAREPFGILLGAQAGL